MEAIAWIGAVVLLHEGMARRGNQRHNVWTKAMVFAGILILLGGAGLWFWSARSYQQLADTLQVPAGKTYEELKGEQLEALPLSQRRDASLRWAKTAFVNGGELLSVVTEDGRLAPYTPDVADVKARDRQLKLIVVAEAQRQGMVSSVRDAETQSLQWLASLLIVLCTGIAAGRSRGRPA